MNNIDKYFKKPLQNLEVTPSDKVWASIEDAGVIGKEKKAWVLPLWSKIAIAALFIIGMFSVAYTRLQDQLNNHNGSFIATADQDGQFGDDEQKMLPFVIDQESGDISEMEPPTFASEESQQENITKSNPEAKVKEMTLDNPYNNNSVALDSKLNELDSIQMLKSLPIQPLDNKNLDVLEVSIERAVADVSTDETPLFRVQIDPDELIRFADQNFGEKSTKDGLKLPANLRDKLVVYAEGQLNQLADASGLKRLSKINEIEIIY